MIENSEIAALLAKGESETLEFKLSFGAEAIQTLNAFANSKGGKLIIGVTDKGTIKGVSINQESIQNWVNEVKQKTEPSIVPDAYCLSSKGANIIVLTVDEYPLKPVSFQGRYYKRVRNSNHLLSLGEVANMHLKTINSSWDYYPRQDKNLNDISFDKIQWVINLISKRDEMKKIYSIDEFLIKQELVKNDSITNACYLLFCKNDCLFTTIELGYFASETVIKDSVTNSMDILNQVDEVMSFIKKHINKEIIITGNIENTQRWQYPLEGIRELVLNMIIHRDYTSSADSIVKIFPNYIEFYNPGVTSRLN